MNRFQMLERTVEGMLTRLEALERLHGIATPPPSKSVKGVDAGMVRALRAATTEGAGETRDESAPATTPPTTSPIAAECRAEGGDSSTHQVPARVESISIGARSASPAPQRADRSPGRLGELERLIGVKIFAVAGALIVVAGAAFFFKLAWDQGWLGRMPDPWKAISGGLFGAALLVAGDVVRRRFGAMAGMGCNAAGVGVLYATAYATHQTLDLVNRPTAFTLLALVSIVGFVVAARSRSAAIACIAMIGTYGAPILLSNNVEPPVAFLPAYWMALTITGAALAALRGAVFQPASTIGWGLTLVFGVWWAAWKSDEHPLIGATFFGAFWMVTHFELIMRARRMDRSEVGPTPRAGLHDLAPWRGALTSLTTTAWAVGLGAWSLHASTLSHLDWMAPAAVFAVTAHLALIQVGSLRVLHEKPETEIERLGVALAASAGALAALTIALALVDWAQAASWFALALAAGAAGRWIRAHALMVYAVAVAALGTASLITLEWWAQAPILSANGLTLSRISVLAIAGGFVWLILSALCSPAKGGAGADRAGLHHLCLVFGLGLLFAAPAHEDTTAQALLAVWLAISVATWLVGFVWSASLHRYAFAGSLLAVGAWLGAESQSEWFCNQSSLGFNAPMLAALAIGALGLATAATERRRSGAMALFAIMIAAPSLWLFGVTTMEVMRIAERTFNDPMAQRAVVSFWWAAIALGLLVGGAMMRNAVARRIGLAVLALAGAKTALYDLTGIEAAWRVATFLGVGAVMLIVAVFYARASRAQEVKADA